MRDEGYPKDASGAGAGNQSLASSVLNIAPIRFSGAVLKAGRLPYGDEETYRTLRESHRASHVFRFDVRDGMIWNVAVAPGAASLGEQLDVPVDEHLLLMGKVVQHLLFEWLRATRTILRPTRPLQCWGNRKAALLSAAIKESGLKPIDGLDVLVRHSFDTRVMQTRGADTPEFLALVLDVDTSNELAIPGDMLLNARFELRGRWVCRRVEVEDGVRPRLETLGRVVGIEGKMLVLADPTGDERVLTSEVLLEPRQEYIEALVQHQYDRAASRILAGLAKRRRAYWGGTQKLEHIVKTLDGMRDKFEKDLRLPDGLTIHFGKLLSAGDPLFPDTIETSRPTFLFGAQGSQTNRSPDGGVKTFGPYKYMQHARNAPLVAVVCEKGKEGSADELARALRDGFPDEMWREIVSGRPNPKGNPFQGGLVGKFRLARVNYEFEAAADSSVEGYEKAIKRLLDRLPTAPDLALVQTRQAHRDLPAAQNPYLISKARFMTAGVPVQGVQLETIEGDESGLAYSLNGLALQAYAKLEGLPFVMSTRGPATHELVIGLGYAETREGRFGPKDRYVGLTTVFQGDGRYLVWGQTKEVEFDQYADALLDRLRTSIAYVREQNNWQPGESVRLIFHVFKPLKNKEIEAVKAVVHELIADQHPVKFAFINVSQHHEYLQFDPSQRGKVYWAGRGDRRLKGIGAPTRGRCVQLGPRSALLQLVGVDEVKTDHQGLPGPLLIDLHSDSDFTDISYLARQIFHFSYLSWRSFFPSPEPITILYSRLIAGSLANLKPVPGWNSAVLASERLRGSMWFL